MELQRELLTDKELDPKRRPSGIVFGILPREALLCAGMNILCLQSAHTWVLASVADLCLVVWSCSLKLQPTPLVTGGQRPKQSTWPAMLCLTCSCPFLQPHLRLRSPAPCSSHSGWPWFLLLIRTYCLQPWDLSLKQQSAWNKYRFSPSSHTTYPQSLAPLGIFLETSSPLICSHGSLGLSFRVLITAADIWVMSLCDCLVSAFAT